MLANLLGDIGRRERVHAGCGKLDGQRDTIRPLTDFNDGGNYRVDQLKAAIRGAGTILEQPDRIELHRLARRQRLARRKAQGRNAVDPLTV